MTDTQTAVEKQSPTEEMRELLGLAKALRDEVEGTESLIRSRRELFEAEIQPVKDALSVARETLVEVETDLRNVALGEFAATGEKSLPWGIGIREKRQVSYDPSRALLWAKEHKMALSLDRKAFEAYMLAMPESERPEWLDVSLQPTATIPSRIDLAPGERID